MKKHVAILMGGFSSERGISLISGKACADAAERIGYRVTRIDVGRDIAAVLEAVRPDVAFNALHGPFGEDGKIQGILEYLLIPYTHSGVLSSALAMHKIHAKRIVEAAGVPVASSKALNRFAIKEHPMQPPYVIKPIEEGSSFGVVIVKEGQECPLDVLHGSDWCYGDAVMAERYIAGRELTCPVLHNEALDVCEIITHPQAAFYDYYTKYAPGGSQHISPASLSPNIYQTVKRISLIAHQALGCRGVTRSDFRYDEEKGELIWLELNTQPGMTPTSLVPDVAKVAGYSFEDLVAWMVEDASCMR